jgi:hypothetical protein
MKWLQEHSILGAKSVNLQFRKEILVVDHCSLYPPKIKYGC